MRRLVTLLLFTALYLLPVQFSFAQPQDVLVDMCASQAGEDATYLKDFIVDLDAAAPGEKEPVQKFSLILSKGTVYRFSVCNSEDSPGEGILRLFDTTKEIAKNEYGGQILQSFDFECNKTGVYHVMISFKDGKSGSAIGILSFIKKI
jgi:hypothetical protein